MNLPALYAAVCAKRPELEVPMLTIDVNPPGWSLCGSWCGEHFAAALILARWVEALPDGHSITHYAPTLREPEEWQVLYHRPNMPHVAYPCEPTPLEAIAAYYLGEAT